MTFTTNPGALHENEGDLSEAPLTGGMEDLVEQPLSPQTGSFRLAPIAVTANLPLWERKMPGWGFHTSATAAGYAPLPVHASQTYHLATGFDKIARETLNSFAAQILKSLTEWEELKGVLLHLEVHKFKSFEEDNLELVRLELHIPGLPEERHVGFWQKLSHLVNETQTNVTRELGSSPEGRVFRKMRPALSTAIIPW